MELLLDFSTDMSDRKAAGRLNRVRLESHGISPTTFRNTVEREGQKIHKRLEEKCEEALTQNGFTSDGELLESSEYKSEEAVHIEQETIERAAAELNIKDFNASDYEAPEYTVNISADDVCVKRQTNKRPCQEGDAQPKRVDNTVIHIENSNGKYILNAGTLMGTLILLIGFLLHGGLLGKQLVFFADGAREIHGAILKMFHFANFKIILDWYHLKKKCQEQLSMALCGRKIRNEFLDKLLPCLWFGNVNGAMNLLRNIDPKKVKNADIITKLIEYLERVRGYIPCYALRKNLGLRNSSNMGEKANDLIVAERQKHNGMSWSDDGSLAFATVASASCNKELAHWIFNRDIGFCLSNPAA
jgi:hypothetical protein